jgi:tetratricopeptide (TPR) repeat protein
MNKTVKILRMTAFLLTAAALFFFFKAFQKQQQLRDKAAGLERAIELSNRAVALSQKEDFYQAIALLKQARRLAPEDSAISANLANVYGNLIILTYRRGDLKKVLELGADARRDSIKNAAIYYLNAQAFCLDNRIDSAVFLLEEGARLLPENSEISQRLAQLKLETQAEQGFEQGRSGYFDIKFQGGQNRGVSDEVLMMLEEIRDRVGGELGHRIQGNTSVILYSDQQFRDITHLASWAGAAFDGKIRVPVANYQNDRPLLEKVLTHEFTHAAIYDMVGGRCPSWLNEGLAMLLEGLTPDEQIYLPLSGLQRPFTAMDEDHAMEAYRASLSASNYLTKQYDWAFVRLLFTKMQQGSDFGTAFKAAYGFSLEEFEKRWKESCLK